MLGGNNSIHGQGFDHSAFNSYGRVGSQFGGATGMMTGMSQGADPFNYPMPGRKDLMCLQTIDFSKDQMKTTTRKFATGRLESSNLNTADIEGK